MASPTLQQIQQFITENPGWFDTMQVKGEQLTLALLLTISTQLSDLAQGLKIPVSTNLSSAPVAQTSIDISVSPKDLNEFIIATEATRGYTTGFGVQFPVVVPAAVGAVPGVIEVPFALTPGYVGTLISPASITTTDVGANVSMDVFVDGKLTIGPQGFTLGPSAEIRTGQYLVAKDSGLLFTFSNPSSSSVTIYLETEIMFMTLAFYNDFYQPLLSYGYNSIRASLGLNAIGG